MHQPAAPGGQPAVQLIGVSRTFGDVRALDRVDITIPTGTQIKVDVSEENPPQNVESRTLTGKVTVPVQVEATVAIPALTKVTIQITTRHNNTGNQELMQLISVTLDGTNYEMHTDQVPIQPGSISEVQFTLIKDLTIKRQPE